MATTTEIQKSPPGRACAPGCQCGRHRIRTDEERRRRGAAISKAKKGVPQRIPQTAEQREKNRQAQLGNQRAKGIKHDPEVVAARAERTRRRWQQSGVREAFSEHMRQRWQGGIYDHLQDCWAGSGVHAGVWMRCLNSEGVFARDCDRAGVTWQYEPRRFWLSWCSYCPDFYLPEFDIWIEVKGWADRRRQEWMAKVDTFRRETGKTLVVVYQVELSSLTYEVGG